MDSIEEIVTAIIDYENNFSQLNATQKASFVLSIAWKENCAELLKTEDSVDFRAAVVWCGKNGNVSRTVAKKKVNRFVKFIYGKRKEIMDGLFDLKETPKFGKNHPISWVSKICHIMNPKQYPIIFDNNIKQFAGFRDADEFDSILVKLRARVADKTDKDIYQIDSAIWAKATN